MTTATLFDGTPLEFPDGTDQGVIDRVVKEQTIKRRVEAGDLDLSTGAPPFVRALVGGAPNEKERLKTIRKFFPGTIVAPDDKENFIFLNPETGTPTLYNPKGLDSGDIPSVTREVVQAAGATAGGTVGAAGGTAVAGPPGTVAGAVAGGTLGAMAGEEAFNLTARELGMEDSRTLGERSSDSVRLGASTAAGDLGFRGVGRLFNIALKRALRGGTQKAADAAERVADFAKVGGQATAGQATRTRGLQAVEGVLSRMPGGAGRFAKKAQETIRGIDEFVSSKATRLAGRTEPEIAGRAIEKGIVGKGGFIERFQTKAGALFDSIGVAGEKSSSVKNTLDFLETATSPVKGAENISGGKLLKKPVLQDTLEALKKDAGDIGEVPFAALKELRSRIGKRLSSFSLVDDVDRGDLKQLYGAITADLKEAASREGPNSLKAFNRANNFYRAGIKRVDETLTPLLRNKVPERIFKALEASGAEGATKIRTTLRSLNQGEKDVVAGTVLSRLGKATNRAQNELGEVFSTETYLTNWNKLSKEAKDALFNGTSLAGLRKDLDTVARVVAGIRESGGVFTNPSGSAGQVVGQTLTMVGGGSAVVGALTNDLAAWGLALTLAAGAGTANLGARLMTNPGFVKWLAASTKIKPNGMVAHLGRLTGIVANSDPDTRDAIKELLGTIAEARPKLTSKTIGRGLASAVPQ